MWPFALGSSGDRSNAKNPDFYEQFFHGNSVTVSIPWGFDQDHFVALFRDKNGNFRCTNNCMLGSQIFLISELKLKACLM